VLPSLIINKPKNKIVFHPVCSSYKMNLLGKMKMIGKACAQQADFPINSGCCGMAGDRGFYYPGLTTAATRKEAEEVTAIEYDGYYSSGKTCEMSISKTVAKNYQSILYLLDEVSA
jgi:D-lactate dehydrogenase